MADRGAKKEKVPRQKMPEQKPEIRRRNFDEVPLGLSPEVAMLEAQRCIQCQETRLCHRMSGWSGYPGFYQLYQGWGFSKGHSTFMDKKQFAGRLRKGLSPGISM